MSAPVSPLPGENCTYRRELRFFLLPLIRINVRLGPRFLISYGSSNVVASFTGVFTVLKDGTRYCKALSKVCWPVLLSMAASTLSIGKGVPTDERGNERVPTTVIS